MKMMLNVVLQLRVAEKLSTRANHSLREKGLREIRSQLTAILEKTQRIQLLVHRKKTKATLQKNL